jgi:hypothetical protein
MLRVRFIALVGLSIITSGCSSFSNWWDVRHGPNPVLQADEVVLSKDNYVRLMEALIERRKAFALSYGPTVTEHWYDVAEAGFGYINEVCGEYIHELLKFEQRTERTRLVINALDKTTSAILGQTTSHLPTITIVASAFGLATGFNDAIRNTYTFGAHEAKEVVIVYQNMKAAYVASAEKSRAQINSPTAVYTLLQGYLILCSPMKIRAEIGKVAVTAQAVNATPAQAIVNANGVITAPIAPASASPNITLTPNN